MIPTTTFERDDPERDAVDRLPPIAGLSVEERRARGRAARRQVPRRAHGDWAPSSTRPDPIELLEEQATTRVPELVAIRYGRMLASPFSFLRGAAAIMAADLASAPRSGFRVQLCGDAHLSNFGVFGTPERRLAFDVNDFDETGPGPWEWDVKRLAASLVVSGRDRGFSAEERRSTVTAAIAEYRMAMRAFAELGNLEVWYAHIDVDVLLDERRGDVGPATVRRKRAELEKARSRDSLSDFSKLIEVVDGEPRIVGDPPLLVPIEELAGGVEYDRLVSWLQAAVGSYRDTLPAERRRLLDQYRLVHLARKVVGIGSVGTRTWLALFLGRDLGDPLFLQIKEAQASVLEPFVGPSGYASHAERVVAGQRLMQAASDVFLGWTRVEDVEGDGRTDFYVRQHRDWKGRFDAGEATLDDLTLHGRMCGWTLARAHARTGDRIALAAYLGAGTRFDDAVASFAEVYADQNERDYKALSDAVAAGRIEAVR